MEFPDYNNNDMKTVSKHFETSEKKERLFFW